jgi:hypothetical protein
MESPPAKRLEEDEEEDSEIDSQLSFAFDIDIEDIIPVSIVEAESCSEAELFPEDIEDLDAFSPLETARIFDLISHHLSGNDIKTLAQVSQILLRRISSSEKCMKKLLLIVDTFDEGHFESLLADVLKSCRCYSNVEISLKNNLEAMKNVDRIIKKFAMSIVNLKITKIGGYKSMLNKPLLLLKLESLELHVVCGRVTSEFLENVCTLKKLTVNGLDQSSLQPCLQQNPQLEELTIYENAFISYFDRNLSVKVPFRLKKLAIFDHLNSGLPLQGELSASQWSQKARLNFFKFLKTQSSSLTSLHMDVCYAEDLNYIIKSLPLLECLEVNKIAGDILKLRLEPNESIERFIASSNGINGFLLYAIVASCVNLKSMFIYKLQLNQFLFIARFAVQLTKFCYFWALETDKPFGNSLNLKNLHKQKIQEDEGINPNLVVQVMNKEQYLN